MLAQADYYSQYWAFIIMEEKTFEIKIKATFKENNQFSVKVEEVDGVPTSLITLALTNAVMMFIRKEETKEQSFLMELCVESMHDTFTDNNFIIKRNDE